MSLRPKTIGVTVLCLGLCLGPMLAAAPAKAQFGSLLRARQAAEAATTEGCEGGRSSTVGGRLVGNLLGGAARDAANRAGVSTYLPVAEFSDQLSAAIACKLDPQEQAQAAEATIAATRGADGEDGAPAVVGQSASWTSNTRADVSGTSTVSSRQGAGADGADCIMVTDVVIIRGEETRAEKRMCRAPGSARYSIVA